MIYVLSFADNKIHYISCCTVSRCSSLLHPSFLFPSPSATHVVFGLDTHALDRR